MSAHVDESDTALDSRRALQMEYGLTELQARVLMLLIRQRFVTREDIEGRCGTKNAKVAVHRLRGELEKFGFDISHTNGVGYWMDLEGRKDIYHKTIENQKELPLGSGGDTEGVTGQVRPT